MPEELAILDYLFGGKLISTKPGRQQCLRNLGGMRSFFNVQLLFWRQKHCQMSDELDVSQSLLGVLQIQKEQMTSFDTTGTFDVQSAERSGGYLRITAELESAQDVQGFG